MASIGGVSGNNMTSSLYNSANVISGLASGLDTEGMIEGLVKSYQTKIQNLSNKATKIEWKQEAYRSIINKMYAFGSKYTSYSSSTNLMSASFFNSAIKVAAMGKNKEAVSASGKTDSDVRLTSVKQLATAARYTTSGNLKGASEEPTFAIDGESVSFDDEVLMGTLSGSLSLKYGGKTVSLVFDPNTDIIQDYELNEDGSVKTDDKGDPVKRDPDKKAKDLANLINKKLENAKITLTSGETKSASELIRVDADPMGRIVFTDNSTAKNEVYMTGASGTVGTVLGLDLEDASEDKPNVIQLTGNTALTKKPKVYELVSGQTMNISLDGKTKSIHLPGVTYNKDTEKYTLTTPTAVKNKDGSTSYIYESKNSVTVGKDEYAKKYAELVNSAVQKEFGNKITVSADEAEAAKGNLKLKIQAPENSNMIVNSDAGKALGIGNTATNYLNTSNTLGELMKGGDSVWSQLTPNKDGKYDFVLNGVTIGSYDKDTKLSTILSDINANSEANVKATYSQTTRTFSFVSKDTGSESKVQMGGGLARALFGDTSASKADEIKNMTPKELLGTADSVIGQFVSVKVDGQEYKFDLKKDDSSMERVVNALNKQGGLTDAGYTAKLSEIDGSLVITGKDGKNVAVEYGNDFTQKLFDKIDAKTSADVAGNGKYTEGKDAIFSVEVNGQEKIMSRASNSTDIDGLTINFKDTFNSDYINEAGADQKYTLNPDNKPTGDNVVTFQSSTDSDKIVDAVKSMVADYNEMLSEIRTQYATMPYQDSSGAFKSYEPLSDDDKASMSESAIQKYEEKAKQGILFADRDLSALYDKLRSVFTPGGADESLLRQMGIGLNYSSADGSAAITLDEGKLRAMLDSDPDAVADIFTRSARSGSGSDGIMQQLKTHLDVYGSTTGATKGILVQQAGTPLSSLTLMNNNWQKQIDNISNDIEKWQDKLTAQVDKYTSMFSKLETLIYQMNSQSSTLAGLMGG